LRATPLWNERLGLTGRADAVEIYPDGSIVPVEYKIGRRHGDTADIQLCAQALCLEEMSRTRISHGFLWLSASRRRHRVVFSPELRQRTEECIRQVRDLLTRRELPDAPDDQRCVQCQFLDLCLPHLVARPRDVLDYEARVVFACES
jgi:CRISPR-associated exonuclease Cas4